jgi:hypothetical protein
LNLGKNENENENKKAKKNKPFFISSEMNSEILEKVAKILARVLQKPREQEASSIIRKRSHELQTEESF